MCLEFCNKFNYLDQNINHNKPSNDMKAHENNKSFTLTAHEQTVIYVISTQLTNSVRASGAFTVHITSAVFPVTTVWFLVLNENCLFFFIISWCYFALFE